MAGFDSPYVPGWDCHGLPIEIKVDGELGSKKAQDDRRPRSAPSAGNTRRSMSNLQAEDFKRLGVFGRWEDPYLTMSAHYQSVIAGAFVDFLEKGYVYKGLKPVNWCINDRTALAEAEVEYENHTSPSIWVRFALTSDPAKIEPELAGRNVYGLIWTTTPWTMPANMAIAYHPKFEYVGGGSRRRRVHRGGGPAGSDCRGAGWATPTYCARFPGSRPRRQRSSGIPSSSAIRCGILADHVTLEQGTGAVHTAPGHGHEDYVVGRQYGIETYCPVDAAGRFFHAEGAAGRLPEETHRQDRLGGKPDRYRHPESARRAAGAKEGGAQLSALLALPQADHLPRHRAVVHRHGPQRPPRRTRSKHPAGRDWMPAWGEERISNMVATRPDWCISRQRVWGVPIIVFYCEPVPRAADGPEVSWTGSLRCSREHTADVWYERVRRGAPARRTMCVREVRRQRIPQRKRTFSTSGSIPDRATWRCSRRTTACPGPRTCTWRAATSTAAGSRVRC